MPGPHPFDASRRSFLAAAGMLGSGLMAGAVHGADDVRLAPPDKQPENLTLPDVPSRKIGFAIVGLGQLALEEVMPAFGQCKLARPVALVSGHADKAERVAKAYDISTDKIYNYDNFDRLKNDNDVDVVYIILPNSMHAEFTIRAHQAHKHVLCEKPMSPSLDECQQMIAAARHAQKKLMIAYRLRYEPFNRKVIELCEQEKLGQVKSIFASNSQDVAPPNIRLSSKLGGGPLGDVGIYCLNATRYVTGDEPIEVSAMLAQPDDDPRFREVPSTVQFLLKYPGGVLAHCGCGFNTGTSRMLRVECEEGYIQLDEAFSYRGQRLHVHRESGDRVIQIDPVNHFAAEMDHFAQCLIDGSEPLTPGEEGLADICVIKAIEAAAASGQVTRVERGQA